EGSDLFLRSTVLHLQQYFGSPIGSVPTSFGVPQSPVTASAAYPTGVQPASYAPEREPAVRTETCSPYCAAVPQSQIAGWLQGVGAGGQVSSDGNAAGLDYSIGGTAFGVDLVGDDAVVGIGGGYGHTYVGQRENLGNGQIDSLHV